MTLGLDLSNSHARAVVVDDQGQVLSRGEHAGASPDAGAAPALERALAGGTVSAAAVVLPDGAASLPPLVAEACRDHLPRGMQPAIVAPGVAAVVAEQWCGAVRGLKHVVALSVGEHVTAGIMLDGRVWTGAHGMAAAAGRLSLNPVEREDYRRLGGLEADVSAGGIVRRVIWRIKSGDGSSILQPIGGDHSRITVDLVSQHARSGDGLAVSVIHDTAKYVGMAVANLAAILDPQAVVLGGLLSELGDLLLDSVRTECSRRLGQAQADRLQILLTPLGRDAAAIGAARLAQSPA